MNARNKLEMKRFAERTNSGVWVNKNIGNGWRLVLSEMMNCWYNNHTYIVDDGWAHLRKALHDGDIVQIDWATGWQAVSSLDEKLPVHRYRVVLKKEWYDDIPEDGILCWVWTTDEDEGTIIAIVSKKHNSNHRSWKFETTDFDSWRYAKPIKPEDLWQEES